MKWSNCPLISVILFLACGLVACNLERLSPEDITCIDSVVPWTDQPERNILYPYASAGDRAGDFPGTSVTLSWFIPGLCLPDRYRLVINDIPMIGSDPLIDELVTTTPIGPLIVYEDGTTASASIWTSTDTFKPGYYWWWVIPYYGDYRGASSPAYRITITMRGLDGRGTVCDNYPTGYHTMIHPAYPRNGQIIHSFSTELVWRDQNPQNYRCNNIWTHRYLILYSQNLGAIRNIKSSDDQLNAVIDPLPDYLWDFDDGLWFYYGDSWSGIGLVFPADISAIPVEGEQSVEITLTSCERVYWIAFHFHVEEKGDRSSVGGTFKSSGISEFDIDPALCEVESAPPPPPPPTESTSPMALVLEPANCRSGPTTEYPVLDILVEGAQLPIQGRNRAGDSWLVEDANISHTCWVHGSMVEVIGDTSLVMIVDPDPPHTAVPEPSDTAPFNCAQYNSNLCSSHPQCIWEGGSCKNKP